MDFFPADTPIEPQRLFFSSDGTIPNNPALPVLVYRKALAPRSADKDKAFRRAFELNGWRGAWTGGVFDYHHFHSRSHEVLAVARGSARLAIGGASGKIVELEAGDVIVLPAGTGHKCEQASGEFTVVGAYPAEQEDYDICKNASACPGAEERIAALPLPEADPLYGADGPLMAAWNRPATGQPD